MNRDGFLRTLSEIFQQQPWPKPLHLLEGIGLVEAGMDPAVAARAVGTSTSRLQRVSDADDLIHDVLGISLELEQETPASSDHSLILGQLLLGRCAELVFEEIYRAEVHSAEFELEDLREGRTDTDYRLYNGQRRPMYRINIKFHGAQFRRAEELVGLAPEDCFALATYKIHSALQKQQEESLPYFFAIVGVPNLTGAVVAADIPGQLVEVVNLLSAAPNSRRPSIRAVEDSVIERLVRSESQVYLDTLEKMRGADWYVLSARRADKLLREMLFSRVFALRVRSFARVFGRAELDMHFSLSGDLTPLREFLRTLRNDGPQRITTLFERGDY